MDCYNRLLKRSTKLLEKKSTFQHQKNQSGNLMYNRVEKSAKGDF